MNRRLLLVTYVFPPAPSPGAQRPGHLARYLAQFGWDVTVLTNTAEAPPFPARVISTGKTKSGTVGQTAVTAPARRSAARRVLRTLKEALLFPDTTALWMPRALGAAYALLQRERFDAILSTAHPPSVHVVGWMLAKKSGLPWIADYRDLWAGNPYLRHGPVRTYLERLLERGMLHRADAITTISEPIAAQLRAFHKRSEVHVIPNAYDPAEWDGVPDAVPQRFDLCFTGSMYDGKRNPDVLFAALAELRSAGDPAAHAARVHFYGPNSSNVSASASRFGVNLQVRQHGMVPRSSALRAQRSAAALLIFLNMDESTANEMGSKYLEYMGAQRPILAIGPKQSVMRDFIDRTGTGWFACDVEECKAALRAAYQRFASGTYEVHRDTSIVPNARSMARRFAGVLDGAASHSTLRGIA